MTKPTGKQNSRYGGRWTPEADEILCSRYGVHPVQHIATKINSELGTRFTAGAVYDRAETLGLDARDCQGLLTLTDAARQVGVNVSTILKFVQRSNLETVGKGKHTYLAGSTWEVVQARWKAPPEPCITTPEAARRLSYTRETITQILIPSGKLRAYRHGHRWMVSSADVERLERIQHGGIIGSTLERKRR